MIGEAKAPCAVFEGYDASNIAVATGDFSCEGEVGFFCVSAEGCSLRVEVAARGAGSGDCCGLEAGVVYFCGLDRGDFHGLVLVFRWCITPYLMDTAMTTGSPRTAVYAPYISGARG